DRLADVDHRRAHRRADDAGGDEARMLVAGHASAGGVVDLDGAVAGDATDVFGYHAVDGTGDDDFSVAPQNAPRAEARDSGHVVADEQDGTPARSHALHLAQALLLERRVSHGQHFVDHQDLRAQVSCDRERQPYIHTARVALDRRIEKAFDLGE